MRESSSSLIFVLPSQPADGGHGRNSGPDPVTGVTFAMRMPITAVFLALMMVALVGCKAPAPQSVHSDVLAKADLQYYWNLELALEPEEVVSRLIRLDENLYFLTSKHRLITIDAARGLLKWSHQIGGPGATVFDPIHADGVVIPEKIPGVKAILTPEPPGQIKPFDAVMINTLSYVLVFDRATGKLYRKIPFDFAANTSGASDGVSFYVGSTNGWYYAILLREAVKGWWSVAGDMITAPIRHYQDRIYVADDSGVVYATSTAGPDKGKKVWTRRLGGPVTAGFHVDSRGCFVGSDDHRIYAFNLEDGKAIWEQPFLCRGPLRESIQVGANTIFQFARRDKFYAINLVTGKQRWSLPEGRKVLALSDGEVFLLTSTNTLLLVDEMLGTVKTSLPLTGWDLFAANVSQPAVYVASRDGKAACIRKVSAGRLTAESLGRE